MSRSAVDWRSATKENYKEFKKRYPLTVISFEDWKKIIYAYNYWFKEYLLETGEKVKIPSGIGDIAVAKRRRSPPTVKNGVEYNHLPVDWAKSHEKGKRIYLLNYHTEGFSFKWQWFKLTAHFKQSGYWCFKPSRVTSRLLAHYLKVDEKYQHLYKEWPQPKRLKK